MRLDELDQLPAAAPGAGISLAASLELHAGATDRLAREIKARNGYDRVSQPVFRHYAQSLIAPSSGLCLFWFQGPDQGHKWELRNVFVSGVTRLTTQSCAGVDLFVTATDLRNALAGVTPSLALIGTGDERDFLAGSTIPAENPNLTATGVPAVVTVPAGQFWTLTQVAFLYTASAAVANRTPFVQIKDPTGRIIYLWESPANLTAGQSAEISLTPGAVNSANGSNPIAITGPLPALTLAPGSQIVAGAVNEDVADTITVGSVVYNTTGLPVSRQYSSMQFPIYAPDDLFVIVSGVTAGQEIHCNADIEDQQLGNIQVVEAV